jgi:exosortase H (IPTLxxWG-CTERM-specific)
VSDAFEVTIVNGCNGVYETTLLAAAILATPTSWMKRVVGIAAAALGIYVLNIGRAASLFTIGIYRPWWFNFAHEYVWQTVVVFAVLAIFMAWANWSIPEGRKTDS